MLDTLNYTFMGAALLVFALSFFLKVRLSGNYKKAQKTIKDAQKKADNLINQKIREAESSLAKKEKHRLKKISNREEELRRQENAYNKRISKLDARLEALDKKEEKIKNLDNGLQEKTKSIDEKAEKVDAIVAEQTEKLSQIAGYSKEEALDVLMNNLLEKAREGVARKINDIEQEVKENAKEKSAKILADSVQKLAVDYASDSVVSVITLSSDEMKGRVIGREGRNIRTFEKETGVDVIVDDTPGAIVLSCFSAVRREVASHAMKKLIEDGRIHPARIEEVVKKSKAEIDRRIENYGKKACLKMNVGTIPKNIVHLIGRLHYRTSYGQNVLKHSMEVGWIAGMIASELGLNQRLARRAGFLHDIGKAIDYEVEGTHAIIGGNFAKKNGEKQEIVDAIKAHHEEVESTNVYCPIVQAADSISGARPGARREVLESYVERLDKLEEIAGSIDGVKQTFAVQAGRELRVIVNPEKIKEDNCAFLVEDIVGKIESEMQYPGQIKVTVIRENRMSGIAK